MAQIIPEPVLGGGMLVMFGMVAVQGMRMLSKLTTQMTKIINYCHLDWLWFRL